MSERWETAEEIAAVRERFAAAIAGWRYPQAYAVGVVTASGVAEFPHVNLRAHNLPSVVLATVCGHSSGSATYELTPEQLDRAIDLLSPAAAYTAVEHPNLAAWRAVRAARGRAVAVFVHDLGAPPADDHAARLLAAARLPSVRPAVPDDLEQVVALAAEHAAYEKAAAPADGLAARLQRALFETGRLTCLVADLGGGELAGYATCTREFSTWQGHDYLHLDCLYLREEHRGLGLGQRLMAAVWAQARAAGLAEVQWNTPVWNEDAIRFYRRLGAVGKEKVRFGWTGSA